jgi:uncharacterized damage-inducible protein DinB
MPSALLANVVERLRGTPARLEERVRGLPHERLTARPGGAWSIQENAGHLLALEPLWAIRLDDYDAGLAVLRAADLTNRGTSEADFNSRETETILRGFREERARTVARLESMDETAAARTAHHPRLDRPMRVMDLAVFVAEHDDHHLARITELRRLP